MQSATLLRSHFMQKQNWFKSFTLIILFMLLALEIFYTQWLSDDAVITIRSILNLNHGFGPTYNLGERVQSFTHPLWFLLLALLSLITKNAVISMQLASLLLTLLLLVLMALKFPRSYFGAVIGILFLGFSRSFIDFTSSGLENPLSNFLLIFAICAGISARLRQTFNSIFYFSLLLSLLALCRLDLLLIIAPFFIWVIGGLRLNKATFFAFMTGSIPFIIWTLFSIFYYGFPFPNTAYAKLGNAPFGGQLAIFVQGLRYFKQSLIWDPITLVGILFGVTIGIKNHGFQRALSIGVLLYLTYIIYIGGDFMAGRFFSAPFLLSVLIIVNYQFTRMQKRITVASLLPLCAFSAYLNHWLIFGPPLDMQSSWGIADERTYYQHNLETTQSQLSQVSWNLTSSSTVLIDCGGLGSFALLLGPSAHVVDQCALADPLLARLPINPLGGWRIGHFTRKAPMGYEESLASNVNNLTNEAVKNYYDVLRLAVRGPLISWERFWAIIKLNLGLVSKPGLEYFYDLTLSKIRLGEYIDLTDPKFQNNLPPSEFGWSYPESWGIWSNNFRSMMLIPLPENTQSANKLVLFVRTWLHERHPYQDVRIYINGEKIKDIRISKDAGQEVEISIPRSAAKSKYLKVEFETNAKRQKELGVGSDNRLKGLGLEGFELR